MSSNLFGTLPHDGDTIRLLVLEPTLNPDTPIWCKMNINKLSDKPDYEALSYTWGEPSPTRLVHIEMTPVEFRSNLHDCLLRLRDTRENRILWIDAICINQDDDEEKAYQIELMPNIYSGARRVVAWLGESADSSDDVLNWVLHNEWEEQPPENLLKPITRFFDRKYWYRTWIIQELLSAQHRLFICGGCEVPGYRFGYLVKHVAHDEQRERLQVLRSGLIRSGRQDDDRMTLSKLLKLSFNTHCTDDRDKIYALLGLLWKTDRLRVGLKANYSISNLELFCRVLSLTDIYTYGRYYEDHNFPVEYLLKALNLTWSTLKFDYSLPAISGIDFWHDPTLSALHHPALSYSKRVSLVKTKKVCADDIFINSPKTPNFYLAFRRVQKPRSNSEQYCVGFMWVSYRACAGYCSDLAAIDSFFKDPKHCSPNACFCHDYDSIENACLCYDYDSIDPQKPHVFVPKLLSAAIQLYEELGSQILTAEDATWCARQFRQDVSRGGTGGRLSNLSPSEQSLRYLLEASSNKPVLLPSRLDRMKAWLSARR